MVQKNRHYRYLAFGIGCILIGLAFLATNELFGLPLSGVGIGVIFLSATGLMKIRFMSRCAEAFAKDSFRPDKMVFHGSHFFLCDTEHHTVGYIRLSDWLKYVGAEKDLKNELSDRFLLMDSNAITMLQRDENRIKLLFRGLPPIEVCFAEKESATELYYALVKVRNENASFEEFLDRYPPEDDRDAADNGADEDEDEIPPDPFEEDFDETEPTDATESLPDRTQLFPDPIGRFPFDSENEKTFDADLSNGEDDGSESTETPNAQRTEAECDRAPRIDGKDDGSESTEAPNAKKTEEIPIEDDGQTEVDRTQQPFSVHMSADPNEKIRTESVSIPVGTNGDIVRENPAIESNLRTFPETSNSMTESSAEFRENPSAPNEKTAFSSAREAFAREIDRTDAEESTTACPRCGSTDLVGETVVTCRNCGHQFFR